MLTDGLEGCGLLWCFYQLFGLSFWRHPFTAEHPLMSKWWNATFLQMFLFVHLQVKPGAAGGEQHRSLQSHSSCNPSRRRLLVLGGVFRGCGCLGFPLFNGGSAGLSGLHACVQRLRLRPHVCEYATDTWAWSLQAIFIWISWQMLLRGNSVSNICLSLLGFCADRSLCVPVAGVFVCVGSRSADGEGRHQYGWYWIHSGSLCGQRGHMWSHWLRQHALAQYICGKRLH